MAHFKRKRARSASSGSYSANGLTRRLGIGDDKIIGWGYPRSWDKIMHTRPTRAARRRLEHKVLRGADADDMTWPCGRKPHIYYW